MFFGRQDELNMIKEKINSKKSESIVVFGRRRVGKSRLINEAIKDSKSLSIFYEAYNISHVDNLNELTNEIRKIFNEPYLYFETLKDLIIFVAQKSIKERIILVIDEYPLLREGEKTDSLIKNALDLIDLNYPRSNLKLILCGSSIEIMSILNNNKMPLHGRFTLSIDLKPLNYYEASNFYKNVSNEEKIQYYSTFGGIPYFLKQINPKQSFKLNLINLFIKENALLKTELNSELNSEINKIENAYYVLNIIGDKSVSYTDIKSIFNNSYPNGSIDYVLNKLLSIKIIEKIYAHSNNNTKKPYYRIKDNAFAFYFAFLKNIGSKLLLSTPEDYYKNNIENDLNGIFIPKKFEEICKQYLEIMNKSNKLAFKLLDLYKYIYNDKANKQNYEFDIVGETKDGLINFECKYQKKLITQSDIDKEHNQSSEALNSFYKQAFFSKNGFDSEIKKKDYILYTLDDLFNIK